MLTFKFHAFEWTPQNHALQRNMDTKKSIPYTMYLRSKSVFIHFGNAIAKIQTAKQLLITAQFSNSTEIRLILPFDPFVQWNTTSKRFSVKLYVLSSATQNRQQTSRQNLITWVNAHINIQLWKLIHSITLITCRISCVFSIRIG